MAKIQNTPPNTDVNMEQQKFPFITGRNTKRYIATLEDNFAVSYKAKRTFCHIIQQSHSLVFTHKSHIHTKPHTWMFVTALFISDKTWKQPRCLSVGEWINELWYIQTMEHYSVLKRNKLSSHEKIT